MQFDQYTITPRPETHQGLPLSPDQVQRINDWADWLTENPGMQTVGVLEDFESRKMCCLGVVCNQAVKQEILGRRAQNGEVSFIDSGAHIGVTGSLPSSMAEWLGLPHSDGFDVDVSYPSQSVPDSVGYTLVDMNDGFYPTTPVQTYDSTKSLTFPEVATLIREWLEAVPKVEA